jgi:hypothetical protein
MNNNRNVVTVDPDRHQRAIRDLENALERIITIDQPYADYLLDLDQHLGWIKDLKSGVASVDEILLERLSN